MDHPLGRLFRQLVERNFTLLLEWRDPEVIQYISRLLTDFTHVRNLYRIRDARGHPLEEVAEMLLEGDLMFRASTVDREYEVKRHIGDFTLFMAGIFPEYVHSLRSSRRLLSPDAFLDYVRVGREAYRAVSQFSHGPYEAGVTLFRKLSDHFELCLFGLHQVRADLDRMQAVGFRRLHHELWG
ncbi:MAG: hypothetical protein QHH30_05235 [candidate division NC10 bacterium]|nr:hypothetical protein [candidate division NC10 bacterium]